MDPATLATSVVGILMPYLIKGGEAIAKKVVDQTFEKAAELYQTIKKNFSRDPYAKETLKRVKEDPSSESRKAALQGVLQEKIKSDAAFATELEKFVLLVREAGDQITQTVKVAGKAKTGNITTIGKVDGNIEMSHSKN